jgi:tetratricopeptide (TPR) repeat protein
MRKLNFVVAFGIVLCSAGSFQKATKAQINLGGYCYSCVNRNNYPQLTRPGSQVGSLYHQAFAEGEKGNYEAEVQIYSAIVRIDPQAGNAYYNRGLLKKNKLNDRAGAIEDFRSAARIYRQKGEDYMFQDCMSKLQSLGAI